MRTYVFSHWVYLTSRHRSCISFSAGYEFRRCSYYRRSFFSFLSSVGDFIIHCRLRNHENVQPHRDRGFRGSSYNRCNLFVLVDRSIISTAVVTHSFFFSSFSSTLTFGSKIPWEGASRKAQLDAFFVAQVLLYVVRDKPPFWFRLEHEGSSNRDGSFLFHRIANHDGV